jgi:hypothetical protein
MIRKEQFFQIISFSVVRVSDLDGPKFTNDILEQGEKTTFALF